MNSAYLSTTSEVSSGKLTRSQKRKVKKQRQVLRQYNAARHITAACPGQALVDQRTLFVPPALSNSTACFLSDCRREQAEDQADIRENSEGGFIMTIESWELVNLDDVENFDEGSPSIAGGERANSLHSDTWELVA
jgi:hypothetical protein